MPKPPGNVKAVTVYDLRSNFKKIADDISDYDTTVIVVRPKNKNVVIISQDEYNSWQETNYLLATPKNRAALQKGITAEHSDKKLTPEEWNKLVEYND